MADAIAKLEDYKRDTDEAKELMQALEDEFKAKEAKVVNFMKFSKWSLIKIVVFSLFILKNLLYDIFLSY